MSDVHNYGQSLAGLEAAYFVVFGQQLSERVFELVTEYGRDGVERLCCELDGRSGKAVPCEIPINVLYQHYFDENQPGNTKRHIREEYKLQRAMLGYLEWNDRNGEYRDLKAVDLSALVHAELYED